MATRQTLRLLAQLHSQIAGITDAQARDLVTAYATSWDEIAVELEDALNELTAQAVDGRVSQNKARKSKRLRASLAVIAERLRELAADAEVRIVGDLDAAVRMAGDAEVGLIRSQLPAGTAELVAGFDRIDDAVIHAIIERTTEQIHARTIPLSRDAIAAMRRELVRGVTVGANPRETASRMLARTQGIFEGGAARANRIARTETLDAMREGARVADRANPTVTGWRWVADFSARTCPACLAMHGSTHAVAEPGPLGHQNCLLPGAVVSGPRALASTTRRYAGEVVDIETRSGRVLSVTENHPILTPHGWVAAGLLREGDDVLASTRTDGPPAGGSPHDHQIPALIEDVAQTLGGSLPVDAVSVPTTPEDFHGDGAGSQVHVVRTNGLLRNDREAATLEVGREHPLVVGDVSLEPLSGGSGLDLLLDRLRLAALGSVGSFHDAPVLLGAASAGHGPVGLRGSASGHICGIEAVVDDPTRHAVGLGESIDRLASGVARDDLIVGQAQSGGAVLGRTQGVLSGPVAPEAPVSEGRSESIGAYPMPRSDDLAAFAGEVVADGVLNVRRRRWEGHVYNLQTGTGWYLANGILTHNCRCTRVPETVSWAELGFTDIEEPPDLLPDAQTYFDGLSEPQQVDILGKDGLAAYQAGIYPMSAWATRRSTEGWRDSYVPSKPPTVSPRLGS